MTRRRAIAVVSALVVVMLAEVGAGVWFDHLDRAAGRPDLTNVADGAWLLMIGLVPATVVGAVIAVSQPRHPVGWLFLAFSVDLMAAGPIDGYATYANFAVPGLAPGARWAALLADREWVPWLVLPALILHLTPDGHYLSPRWRLAARVMIGAAVLLTILALFSNEPMNTPFEHLRSPLAIASLPAVVEHLRVACAFVMGAGLTASAASLVVRFRRSRDDERRQLLWLTFVVVPAPIFVGLAFGGSMTNHDTLTGLGTFGFVTLIPVAAGLSVLRYRLYDVERLVAATTTWVALSVLLVAVYATVVWLGARAVPSGAVPPAASATLGALAAAAVAAPARRGLQSGLDRRFNRRAHEASHALRTALGAEVAGVDIEAVLRDALADPSVVVAYPGKEGSWLTATGEPAAAGDHVDVDRHGRLVARIGFDPERTSPDVVRRAAALAAPELDNTRLRAELARQLGEIDASRRRLANAQRHERRKIERDLHDGAQQRLLALALELQSARLNGEPSRMHQALGAGAQSARAAVRELRALANGLHPAALEDGGLSAALDDMARLSPIPVRVSVETGRLDRSLEFTAWSVIGEAVVNAQKHAGASAIRVEVSRENGHLHLEIADDGHGGANPDGPGLRGLRDRVETARGNLTVSSAAQGTTIQAVLPLENALPSRPQGPSCA